MSIAAEQATKQLMWTVQALACPAHVQLKLFPDFAHTPDELVLNFDNWYRATKWRDDLDMTVEKLNALALLDSYISTMPSERFDIDFVINGEDWKRIRDQAHQVLGICGWPFDVPPSERSSYVQST